MTRRDEQGHRSAAAVPLPCAPLDAWRSAPFAATVCSTGSCSTGSCSTGSCSTGSCSLGSCSTGSCSTGSCSTGSCSLGSRSGGRRRHRFPVLFSSPRGRADGGRPWTLPPVSQPGVVLRGEGERVVDMSDVRLSNGSPTLERTDAGRVSVLPKPSACRSLFGAPDHDERQRELKGLLREMEEAASAKWDFNFGRDTPRPGGRFAWEAVDCREVPAFYRDKEVCCAAGRSGVDLNGNVSCSAGGRTDGGRECREPGGGPRKRPASHDPPTQNKRSHSSTQEVGAASLSCPAELTPRKKSPRRQT